MEKFKIKPKFSESTARYAHGLCRTKSSRFLMQANKIGDQWHIVSASNFEAEIGVSKSFDKREIAIDGNQVFLCDTFRCPSCKNPGILSCGACGKIACWDGESKTVTCPNCNHEGAVSGRIKTLSVEPTKEKGSGHESVKTYKAKHSPVF
jgi:hypothetical protein